MIRVHQWVARGRRLKTWHKVALGLGAFGLLAGGSIGLGAAFADKNPEVIQKPTTEAKQDDSKLLPSKAYEAREDDDEDDASVAPSTPTTQNVQGSSTTTPTAPRPATVVPVPVETPTEPEPEPEPEPEENPTPTDPVTPPAE